MPSDSAIDCEKGLAKVGKVARILGTTEARVYQLARDKVLPPGVVVRIGRQVRFDCDALLRWIQGGGSIDKS